MKNKDKKYQLELEVVEIKEVERPKKMVKMAKKSLKKLMWCRINGRTGEC